MPEFRGAKHLTLYQLLRCPFALRTIQSKKRATAQKITLSHLCSIHRQAFPKSKKRTRLMQYSRAMPRTPDFERLCQNIRRQILDPKVARRIKEQSIISPFPKSASDMCQQLHWFLFQSQSNDDRLNPIHPRPVRLKKMNQVLNLIKE